MKTAKTYFSGSEYYSYPVEYTNMYWASSMNRGNMKPEHANLIVTYPLNRISYKDIDFVFGFLIDGLKEKLESFGIEFDIESLRKVIDGDEHRWFNFKLEYHLHDLPNIDIENVCNSAFKNEE